MKTKKVIAALSVLCSALTCGISQASIVSVDWTGTNSVYSIDSRTFVMGYSFSVTSMVTVGFLGAFTTFSTFELEIWGLIKENQFLTAFLYLFLSVALGFAGVIAGASLARKF